MTNTKEIVTRLTWKKPVIIAISKEALLKHIKVAARSGGCKGGGNAR